MKPSRSSPLHIQDPLVDAPVLSLPEETPYETMRKWRRSERSQMIEAVRDLIEESRKRAKSNYTPSKERARWTRLAGQLIWYKDQILRSMSYEALEEEVAQLKEVVRQEFPGKDSPKGVTFRRTVQTRTGKTLPLGQSIVHPLTRRGQPRTILAREHSKREARSARS